MIFSILLISNYSLSNGDGSGDKSLSSNSFNLSLLIRSNIFLGSGESDFISIDSGELGNESEETLGFIVTEELVEVGELFKSIKSEVVDEAGLESGLLKNFL